MPDDGSKPSMAIAVIVLPQPDSPTRPVASPAFMLKLIWSTTVTFPEPVSNQTLSSLTLSAGVLK